MKHRLLFPALLLACLAHAQQHFVPDAFGYVADPKFAQLIQERGYELVGAFAYVREDKALIVAGVRKNGEWRFIDWTGKEYADENTMRRAVGLSVHHAPEPFLSGSERIEPPQPPLAPGQGAQASERTIRVDGKTGFVSGKDTLLRPVYDRITPRGKGENRCFIVEKNGQYGVIDARGRQLIPLEYTSIEGLRGNSETLAFKARKDEKVGILARNGTFTIPFRYTYLHWEPGQRYIAFRDRSEYNAPLGALDTTGKAWVPASYSSFNQPKEGSCLFVIKGQGYDKEKIGAVNAAGVLVLDTLYSEFQVFNGSRYIVSTGPGHARKDGLFDASTGKLLLPCIYDIQHDAFGFGEATGYTPILLHEGGSKRYGVIDSTGSILVPLEYETVLVLDRERLLILTKDGHSGIRNYDLQEVVPAHYQELSTYRTQGRLLFIFRKDGKKGVMDLQEQVLVPAIYDEFKSTHFGLIYKREGNAGIVDATGKQRIEELPDARIDKVVEGLIELRQGRERFYMDFYGHKVLR